MNVLSFGFFNKINAGDDRLQYSITKYLVDRGHDVTFVNHNHLPHKRFLNQFDWILIGGGGLVFGHQGIWQNMRKWMRSYKGKIGVWGIGVNSLSTPLEKELNELILRSEFFFVRDDESKALLGNHPKVNVSCDLTWLYPIATRATRVQQDIAVSFAPCTWRPFDAAVWGSSISEISDANIVPWPFFYGQRRDLEICEQMNLLNWPAEFSLDPLYNADIVIGSRFHSLVFSIMAGKPFVAVSYDHKIERLMKDLELEQLCLNTDESSSVSDAVKYIRENRALVMDRISKYRQKCLFQAGALKEYLDGQF